MESRRSFYSNVLNDSKHYTAYVFYLQLFVRSLSTFIYDGKKFYCITKNQLG